MKHYETAVKFEKACNVRRALEAAGKKPTTEDDRYINELRYKLDKIDTLTGDTWTLHWNGQNWVRMHPAKCPHCTNSQMAHSILCVPAADG